MKKFILLEILNHLEARPNFKRKLKVFAVIGLVGLLMTVGLTIWAGVAAVRFATNQIQTVDIQSQADNLESRIKALPAFTTASCLRKAQSLMNFETWMTTPLADNLKSLKVACLENPSPACEEDVCDELKVKLNTAEK